MKMIDGWLALMAALLLTGCGNSAATNPSTRPAGAPTVAMAIGNKTYTLELAADELSRQLGLMNRDHMASDHGMLFVFPDSQNRGFWMKNTLIPLDIIFLDAAGKVVSVQTMKPRDETTTPSGGPAKYAIELDGGESSADGVKQGDSLTVPVAANEALKN